MRGAPRVRGLREGGRGRRGRGGRPGAGRREALSPDGGGPLGRRGQEGPGRAAQRGGRLHAGHDDGVCGVGGRRGRRGGGGGGPGGGRVGRDGALRLESIWPNDKVSLDTIDAGARMLRQDTLGKGGAAYREVGEKVPEFVLYDQNGRVVDSARFRGRQVMLNFIYTRCPVANMCPLSTSKMMATQGLARKSGVANIEFVSITLDPAHDTPGILREYADARGIDTANFSFLTGPESAIRDLLTQFGVIAEFKGDLLNHTLATLLIDEKGRISWRADGSAWQPGEFVERMHR